MAGDKKRWGFKRKKCFFLTGTCLNPLPSGSATFMFGCVTSINTWKHLEQAPCDTPNVWHECVCICSWTEICLWSYIWGFTYLQRSDRSYWLLFCNIWEQSWCLWCLKSDLTTKKKVECLKSNLSIYKTVEMLKTYSLYRDKLKQVKLSW